MMINKRLIHTVTDSKKYIKRNVLFQWCSLLANVGMIFGVAILLEQLLSGEATVKVMWTTILVFLICLPIRFVCSRLASRMSYLSSKSVKQILRQKIYEKMLRLGTSYTEKVSTTAVVQMAVEGVDQLETYFGSYLPQFFYSILAPLTLFGILAFVNLPSALVLLICVPLIPVAIAGVQTFAKKLLAKYWGKYTSLGDTFLENLQGLTTLKIYQADAYKNEEMNHEAEEFRVITMKVLTMQLNSITIMDVVAYGGAGLGMIVAVTQYLKGNVSAGGCLAMMLLSGEFFIPMRLLGSYFHIAMNGMAASDKIFGLLDIPEEKKGEQEITSEEADITCKELWFSYEEDREILRGLDLHIPAGSFTGVVGESGCGKSTLAAVLMGRNKGYRGQVTIGGNALAEIREESLMKHVTYVSHNSYLFKGTVRENLLMGNPAATEEQLWEVLCQTRLDEFLIGEQGLDTWILEKASNLSGGQGQRLALARALLHNTAVYIFDEATSNIDVESEDVIMEQVKILARNKTVILISHRLFNVVEAEQIFVLKKGHLVEQGCHEQLLKEKGVYKRLWDVQQSLENYGREEKKEWGKEAI